MQRGRQCAEVRRALQRCAHRGGPCVACRRDARCARLASARRVLLGCSARPGHSPGCGAATSARRRHAFASPTVAHPPSRTRAQLRAQRRLPAPRVGTRTCAPSSKRACRRRGGAARGGARHAGQRRQGRARVLGRPRHVGHSEVAKGGVRLRGHHLHRGPRPGAPHCPLLTAHSPLRLCAGLGAGSCLWGHTRTGAPYG